ncbi:aldo/keto reductase [Lacticaseibacillus sp. GG6-2]
MADHVYTLNNGLEIPKIAFGTWLVPNDSMGVETVKAALQVGYRHVDTAAVYGNEEAVGQGIKASGIPRSEIFVTTKLWNDDQGYDATKAAFQTSLHKLGLTYIDMYLIHSPADRVPSKREQDTESWQAMVDEYPVPDRPVADWATNVAGSWRAMEDLYHEGKIKALGVSNFYPAHFKAAFTQAEVQPMVNQIRLNPQETLPETTRYDREHNIVTEAYSPFGQGRSFRVPIYQEIAAKYHKSVSQILLAWSLSHGYLPLPKAMHATHMRENLDVFDFELDQADIEKLDALG